MISNTLLSILFLFASLVFSNSSHLKTEERLNDSPQSQLRLSYSDGRPDSLGLNDVNEALFAVGVRVSSLPLPKAASPILKASQTRAITPEEATKLISVFYLGRRQLLAEITKAGRKPAVHNGGFLSTSEVDVPPYPKVYDMKAMTPEVVEFLQVKKETC